LFHMIINLIWFCRRNLATSLDGFKDLEYIKQFLREHRLENRDDEPFDFLDNEENVRLTKAGRARCHEYGL
jgi:hypothetical protein